MLSEQEAARIFLQDTDGIISEVKRILLGLEMNAYTADLEQVCWDTMCLYYGTYDGYRACNTHYHDLNHAFSVFLLVARIIHGAILEGFVIDEETAVGGLVAALTHDIGFLQPADDDSGTGAKYTIGHEERSKQFVGEYLSQSASLVPFTDICRTCIDATNLSIHIADLDVKNDAEHTMAKIIGSADLVAQLSDRWYLDKLLFLYREFREGGVPGYASEFELLAKTGSFYRHVVVPRLQEQFDNVHNSVRTYFRIFMGEDRDYYTESIESNLNYLDVLVSDHAHDYRQYLRRYGVVNRLRSLAAG